MLIYLALLLLHHFPISIWFWLLLLLLLLPLLLPLLLSLLKESIFVQLVSGRPVSKDKLYLKPLVPHTFKHFYDMFLWLRIVHA